MAENHATLADIYLEEIVANEIAHLENEKLLRKKAEQYNSSIIITTWAIIILVAVPVIKRFLQYKLNDSKQQPINNIYYGNGEFNNRPAGRAKHPESSVKPSPKAEKGNARN